VAVLPHWLGRAAVPWLSLALTLALVLVGVWLAGLVVVRHPAGPTAAAHGVNSGTPSNPTRSEATMPSLRVGLVRNPPATTARVLDNARVNSSTYWSFTAMKRIAGLLAFIALAMLSGVFMGLWREGQIGMQGSSLRRSSAWFGYF
jgi:hypothetical protein